MVKPVTVKVDALFVGDTMFPLASPVDCKVVRIHKEVKAMFPKLKCPLEGKWKRSGQLYRTRGETVWVLDTKHTLESFRAFLADGEERG